MNRAGGNWRRPLALAIALALPGSALAVGLGEARVDSYLNQPLDVRMRLLDASVDDLDTLTVTPASPAEFDRLGVMSDALALGLQISVDRSESPPVIRVRSNRPVDDPVVQLLIDARWAGGRMLREYTLFLDPPTLPIAPPPAPAPVRPPAEAARTVPAPMTRQTPDAIRPAQQQVQPPPSRPQARAVSGRTYGPVGNGETLWSIARSALPADGITMNQMMMAIVELNPDAFRDRNINQLLRGAQLQLPTAEQARALDAAAAAAAVAEQNRAFRTGSSRPAPVVSDAARVPEPAEPVPDAPAVPGSTAAATVDHRLELVPPTDQAGGSGLAGDDAAEVESLRQQLARAEEELFAARQESQEFQARLTELETLVRDRQGGLGLRDAELAGLEQALRDARAATEEGADPALRSDVSERLDQYLADLGPVAADAEIAEPGAAAGAEGASETAAAQSVAETSAGAAAEPVETATVDTPVQAPVKTTVGSEKGWISRLLGAPMWLLGVGLALLIGGVVLVSSVLKRNRSAAETTDVASTTARRRVEPSAAADEDPLQRARAGVRTNPADLAAHLALLQALSASADEQGFGDALEAMFEHVESGSEPEWRQALELAERVVPGHALVKGSADWVADTGAGEAAPASELDQEAEVDDLMSRLDADMDDPADAGWVEQTDEAEPDRDAAVGPLLRADQDEKAEFGRGSSLADDDTVDFSDWLDEDEPDSASTEVKAPEPDSDHLVLDWPDAAVPAGDAAASGSAESEGKGEDEQEMSDLDAQDEAAEDDLFSQGDDDVEVKLDLARAYVSWNSTDSARTLLEEILREGNEAQRDEARKLLDGLSDGEG